MTDPAPAQPRRTIVVDYDLPRPPALVWRTLTEPALLAAWLMPNDIAPVVGHRFTFTTKPAPGWDGVVHCEVLAVEPPRLLRYSWRGGSQQAVGYGFTLDTVVTWTLTATAGGGTLLHLEHSGFGPENEFAFQAMGNGWKSGGGAGLAKLLTTLG
ncbi:MAG TPA: SRPBCC domain-containing protein [Kofleriaceae bacterium]|nr:SRPBCC domain-containing protein [Kofleriaceae bacterium]